MTEAQLISMLSIWALVAAIVSVILAVLAIVLSALFFYLSNNITISTREAAKTIETLFNTFYKEYFTMFKTTHERMEQKIFSPPKDGSDESADLKKKMQENVVNALQEEISNLTAQKEDAEKKFKDIQEKLPGIVTETVNMTMNEYEKLKKDTLKTGVVSGVKILDGAGSAATPGILTTFIPDSSVADIVSALYTLKEDGSIDWSGDELSISTPITLKVGAPKKKL